MTFLNSIFGKLAGKPIMASHERLKRPTFCGRWRGNRSHELLSSFVDEQAVRGVNSFPDEVSFMPQEVFEVWFRPDGTCDGAEMTLSEGGRIYRLFLEPSTSLTEITEE